MVGLTYPGESDCDQLYVREDQVQEGILREMLTTSKQTSKLLFSNAIVVFTQ